MALNRQCYNRYIAKVFDWVLNTLLKFSINLEPNDILILNVDKHQHEKKPVKHEENSIMTSTSY